MAYIGIDIGTSSVKLLLIDEAGNLQKSIKKEYPISFPHAGWAEQNPEDWWQQTCEGLRDLLDNEDASGVSGIGVAGQMHGLVVLDKSDHIIRPAILWNDGRSQDAVDYLNGTIGKQTLTKYTANIAFAGFTAPKLLWLKWHEPQNYAAISKIMLPKDYIVYRLTGVHSCDPSDASGTLLYDVAHKCWSEEMMQICGVCKEQMPNLFESFQTVGFVKPQIAASLGLSEFVPVCAGAGDNAAAAVGCGVVGKGKCNLSLGTSGTIFISNDTFSVDPGNALHSFAHADGKFHQMGCILSAAACNQWWMTVLGTADYTAEQSQVKQLGENDVYYLPYLMGERSPHNDTCARSAFVGMNMNSDRADMTQAVLEGVAFAIRDCVEAAKAQGLEIKESMICGGGAKSALWNRIFANVLGITLHKPRTEQGPAYGAAILAAVSAGKFPSVAQCCSEWVASETSIVPEPELTEKYEQQYWRWRELYPALKGFFVQTAGKNS